MGMTMTQKIMAAHAGLEEVHAGELIRAKVDMVLANDITGSSLVDYYEENGFDHVFDNEKIALVMDHFVPNKDIKSAEQCMACRSFAKRFGITHWYDVGEMGVEHALLPEKGLVAAGELILGADSHTCTYGALGAFSTGIGTTDLTASVASGETWFKVPSAIRFVLKGKKPAHISGKDIILHIIGMIGVDGALYKSMEFTGEGVASLSMEDRFTICNMAIEAGGKNGIFPVDDAAKAYMEGRVDRPYKIYEADPDAEYEATYEIDLESLEQTVAFPHLPENTHTVSEIAAMEPIKIDQVVIGSCTNGRMQDMRQAAEVLKGKHIAPDVRAIIVPATQAIVKQCIKEGLVDIFIDAGCSFNTPSCGPCMGGHMGILGPGERCVSTTNRNFVGRMGHVDSEIYLASPIVAAESALTGCISGTKLD